MDFISDLHLAEALPATVEAWADYLERTTADAVFILGDLFEVWVGDDAAALPFEARCIEVLSRAARRRPTWLLHGNRDFLLGEAFFSRTGVQPLADPACVEAFGTRVLVTHGDALCVEDTAYQAYRRQVRTPPWQTEFLAQPLQRRMEIAAAMRGASKAHQRDPVTLADADPALAGEWLRNRGAGTLIHGHTHRPGSDSLGGFPRHVLSDWDLDDLHSPRRAEVLRWTAQGFLRLLPADAG